ncbi:hypothetical protein Tco_0530434 [Tanacetum coccineum]
MHSEQVQPDRGAQNRVRMLNPGHQGQVKVLLTCNARRKGWHWMKNRYKFLQWNMTTLYDEDLDEQPVQFSTQCG